MEGRAATAAVGDAAGLRRRRILFVINSLAGGGAERVMATILTHSKDRLASDDIALALLDSDPPAFALPPWLEVIRLDSRRSLLRSVIAIDRLVGRFNADVTISFLTRANIATAVAMLRRRRPFIISERTAKPAHLGGSFRRIVTHALMRLLYRRATRVIAVSRGVAAHLAGAFGVKPGRIAIIANPIDPAALEAAAAQADPVGLAEPYVIAIGRLVSVKNYRLLIEAFGAAAIDCRLVIAGDGPERAALERRVEELGLGDRILFAGWLANPYPTLRKARAFALSSDVEGFPNALVEALALGVPSVATDCRDGPAEILAGTQAGRVTGASVARAGVLAPVGDVFALARALELVVADPTSGRLAGAGRARALDYAAGPIVERYWDIIEAALPRAAAPLAT